MDRVKYIGEAAKNFAHENKDLFIVIADPKTDTLFAGYNDSFTFGTIKGKGSRKEGIIKQVLLFSKYNKAMTSFRQFKFYSDILISALVEFLWLPINRGKVNEFYKFISDALFYLPKGSKYKVEEPEVQVKVEGEVKVTLDDVLKKEKVSIKK